MGPVYYALAATVVSLGPTERHRPAGQRRPSCVLAGVALLPVLVLSSPTGLGRLTAAPPASGHRRRRRDRHRRRCWLAVGGSIQNDYLSLRPHRRRAS